MHLTIATKLRLISAVFIAVTASSIITAFYIGGSRSLLTSSPSPAAGGTGLGLSITSMIVQQHRGSIRYHDNHGGGSSFRVTLPVHISSLPETSDG